MTQELADDPRIGEFQHEVWAYFATNKREMPWRSDHSPYSVLVSELMLQQTQVPRVIPKYAAFMEHFPTIAALAGAPLSDVLIEWQGLGYNRRARFLHEAAKMVVNDLGGIFPHTLEGLIALPGVGKNTAGAIMAYAYDQPVIFIETNIRTVLFHWFFDDETTVDDKQLAPLLQAALPDESVREWYWALMDYGTFIKQTHGGRLDQSRHYKKQSPLKGSVREVRGQIIRLLKGGSVDELELREAISADDRFEAALNGLIKDKLVTIQNARIGLTA